MICLARETLVIAILKTQAWLFHEEFLLAGRKQRMKEVLRSTSLSLSRAKMTVKQLGRKNGAC